MGIRLKFIQDDSAEDVEVIIKAKSQDVEVENILDVLSGLSDNVLTAQVLSDEKLIDVKDVIIISKDGRFLSVKTINGEYILKEPLYKIEAKLDKNWFIKISQSEIVNLKYVKKWDFEGGGIIRIELINGIKSYTSRRHAVEIRKILKKGGK